MKRFAILPLIVVGISLNTNAMAQDDKTMADLRCLVAISEISSNMEKAAPGSSLAAAMYYFGRLDGRTPDLNIEDAVVGLANKMTRQDIGTEAIRCGGELRERGAALKSMGERLIARGNAAEAKPAPTTPSL
jgi:hypothetical protein